MSYSNFSSEDQKKVKTLVFVLCISFGLLVIKFIAWYITKSNAILTDALESIVNVVAGSFALYSIYYASIPSDENHPYGHGKIEFLSSGFEGGLIFIAGISIIINAIYSLFKPPVLQSIETGVILSAATGTVNFIMGTVLVKKGNKSGSLLMTANGKHLISDTVSSIGLVIGLALIIATQLYWIDNIMAIIFGAVILITGYKLIKKSITSLLDEADYGKLKILIHLLQKNRNEKWIDIHNLRVIKYGTKLHVDCHITLPWYDSLEDAHEQVTAVEKLISKSMGSEVEFFIHADPCIMPASCGVCQVHNCKHRKAELSKVIRWELSNILPNKKHGL